MLKAKSISYKAGKKYLLHDTSLEFEKGLFHVIMGANGAGKSTLLKLLAGEIKPFSGKIFLEEKELESFSKKELAKKRAVLSQHYNITFPITVNDIVMMGRYPYFFSRPSKNDYDVCDKAMETMDVRELTYRDYTTLSGGESQKVQMSRVLAQIAEADPLNQKLLFLDEPVSHLDVKYQQQLLKAAKDLCQKNVTVIAILHDLNLAISYADRIIFMKNGEVPYDFNDIKQITSDVITDIFDISSSIIYADSHKPVIIF